MSGLPLFDPHKAKPAPSRIFVKQQHQAHDSVIVRASNEHNSVFIGSQLVAVDADLSLPSASNHLRRSMDQTYQTKLPAVAGAIAVTNSLALSGDTVESMEVTMGRGILLWLLGVPIPIIILLALIWH
jgi:hypothetical protein